MSDTPGALGRWIRIYEASGEMPPAGVLLKHLDEHDAEDARRDAVLRQAREALNNLSRGMNSSFDSLPAVKAEEVRAARAALAAIDALSPEAAE